ncbi:DUF6527 family protein [Pseudonocardia sp. GCM10023141]|uniref:DUF6527 family protein n=1 Tax=Pseudonocardia sp. GCM10023141 TaxID=3252653 RepID=UPI003623B1E9
MITQLQPRLVSTIPEQPEPGVLYVSVKYATTLHLCACGCSNEVVLGISPHDWKITWDGPTVTISPSVGSWSLPCQSHYLIRRNEIRWAQRWSSEEIERGRTADTVRKRSPSSSPATPEPLTTAAVARPRQWWRRLLGGR